MAAVQDALGITNKEAFKAASAFGGGVGLTGDGCCGGYLGRVVVLSSLVGRERDDFVDPEGRRVSAYRLARRLREEFIAEYGSVICRNIHTKILGRPYYILDPDEMAKFEAVGGHSQKCPEVVANSAGWVTRIILEEGLLGKE